MNNNERDILKGEDIFAAAGKRMPYRLPEGALDAVQDRVMEAVGKQKRRRAWIMALVPTAVAAAVALAVIFVKPNIATTHQLAGAPVATATAKTNSTLSTATAAEKNATTQKAAASLDAVDKAFAQLSAADQQYVIDLYEASETMTADYYN